MLPVIGGRGRLDDVRVLSRGLSPFGRGIFVGVGVLHFVLFAGLHGFPRNRGRGLAVMFLFLNDFLIVGNVSWIGHRLLNRPWGLFQPYFPASAPE
jgi:hypothetical protein